MDSELEPIHTLTDFIRFQKLVFPATKKQPITGLHALPAIMAEHDFFRKPSPVTYQTTQLYNQLTRLTPT
jgi:hypothetical protein